jgi:predicted glutamine amidotransferase
MCRFLAVRGQPDAMAAFLRGPTLGDFQKRSHRHQAGWGIAWYHDGHVYRERKPVWIHGDAGYMERLREIRPDILILHTRRATRGKIAIENTHPFVHANWSFAHNGTIVNRVTRLLRERIRPDLEGETDSETFFHWLLHCIHEQGSVTDGVREAVRTVLELSPTARLNFVLSDGKNLHAFRRGHTLYHFLVVASGGLVEGISSDNLVPGSAVLGRDWLITVGRRPDETQMTRIIAPYVGLTGTDFSRQREGEARAASRW